MDNKNVKPEISVVMPVFNAEKFVKQAVESILKQTFTDFEFIIIDDGSTDLTAAILDLFSDARIVRINHKHNEGLVKSLNDGINQARGEFIARMDADDISLPERFGLQYQYLQDHPEIGALGGNFSLIGADGQHIMNKEHPLSNQLIKWKMCFENPIQHPTVMMRRDVVKNLNGYRDFKASEDYDLWQRMSEITQLGNINQKILNYRHHGNNLTSSPNENRSSERNDIRERAIMSILGENEHVDWVLYWNDPFYSSKTIYKLQKKHCINLNKNESKQIRLDAGRLIFRKATAIQQGQLWEKFATYLMAFSLNPSLIKTRVELLFQVN